MTFAIVPDGLSIALENFGFDMSKAIIDDVVKVLEAPGNNRGADVVS
ncbi:hypothetical protein [Pseudomonas sp. SJZ131]|nr:hypothetical protein [Pseudomonas sp. SJZ131]TWD46305.1 hypothetical protein FBY12_3821 [Pseudomonas sp. SJZ131]